MEEEIDRLTKLEINKEYNQTKKYWKNYLDKHDGLKIKDVENKIVNARVKEIYKRTILLFPLLQNEENWWCCSICRSRRTKTKKWKICILLAT